MIWAIPLLVVLLVLKVARGHEKPAKKRFYDKKEYSPPKIQAVSSDFDWQSQEPLKSYPFKNAAYKLTMGIKSLDVQDWLLVENSYKKVTAVKSKIINNSHPAYPAEKDLRSNTLLHTDEAFPAIKEFYSVATSYMCDKYPMYFVREGDMIHNKINNIYVPSTCSNDVKDAPKYLEYLTQIIEEDFIILLKDPSKEDEKDGTEYFFKAGVFAFAAGFNPRDRFNAPLSFVHHPIPGYEEKLKLSMNRFFNRIVPGQFVTRSNFSVQTHDKYYVDDSNKGHNLPKDHVQVALDYDSLDFDNQVHYRSERQVLTKLPESGAVVFTIRTYLHPMSRIKSEGPEVCERLVGAIEGFPPDIVTYKRAGEWGPPLIKYLRS
ncbi:uncharacterized protein CANTADRAFT_55368 [Suhomyces tanzawaensis NRRL Y-17324]|uniref:Uncharacterized protein n=1 Tax=Suhomyces tanzawaensis NRRL Y-17324 TaxID=984487 RepID=A0A1E4SF91_9ASCO|nr:uncharacterized protein CANTADRAFT_55368 [Suhomyces tanzawaensis NRRL Y-17324]ODV78143.1 hypothetical protein CANTADRAFT_55368 [Suhomyces tanzawaensis NRRL Y-17324]